MPEKVSLQVEEITDWDALEGIRPEWSALCDRSPRATPFQRPEWLLPWGRAFPPGEPWILTVREGARLVGLAPFLVYLNGGQRTVAFCGGGVSDYCDVVTDPDREDETVSALLACLSNRRDRWETGDFEPVPEGSPLLRICHPALKAGTEPRDVCPGLDLPDRIEDLHEVVPTRQLSNLRKYRRKAEALGDLRLESVETPDVVLDFYTARRNPADEDRLRSFHREVAAGFQARGALSLHVLCLEGAPIAGLYGFRERDTLYCYMQGFDAARAKLSPGVLLVGGVIQEAIRSGVKRIDFLRGREPYKYWWGAKDRETFRKRLRPVRDR
jgi:CelD/BcsL family acetyltransferase involved in cellulose biosynthesis